MNKLSIQGRVQILNCLSEGVGINAAARMTGKSKNTILKLLTDVGEAFSLYQDRVMRNLTCKRVECDEKGALSVPSRRTCAPTTKPMQTTVTTVPSLQLTLTPS